jgi:hypothetical protein
VAITVRRIVGRTSKARDDAATLSPTEIDELNRLPIQSQTPQGEFVVDAIETYNWLRLNYSDRELEDLRSRIATTTNGQPSEMAEFLDEVRIAASRAKTPEEAIQAIRKVLLDMNDV